MIVAVDTRLLFKRRMIPGRSFLSDLFLHVARQHPEHEFVFLLDRAYDTSICFPLNVKGISKVPDIKHSLMARFWHDLRLARVLKKIKPDLFISIDQTYSRITLPQYLLLQDAPLLLSILKGKGSSTRSKRLKRSLAKSEGIMTLSGFMRDLVTQFDPTTGSKTAIMHAYPPGDNETADEVKKTMVRERFTAGKQFFLYAGPLQSQPYLINLLKAFSVFKKRQKSDWKLVLAGWHDNSKKSIVAQLSTYKHRGEVVIVEEPGLDIAELYDAAYTFIYPVEEDGSGIALMPALKKGVPVIAAAKGAAQEIAGDAAVYVDPTNHLDIAEEMMRLYKDEAFRSRQIGEGEMRSRRYTRDAAAGLFWQSILRLKP